MKTSATSAGIYVKVWAALLILLLLTWVVAQFKLGAFNLIAALGIAALKMMLVILFFMHVRSSRALTWLFVAGGFIWFLILMDLTLSDYLSRTLTGGWPRP